MLERWKIYWKGLKSLFWGLFGTSIRLFLVTLARTRNEVAKNSVVLCASVLDSSF